MPKEEKINVGIELELSQEMESLMRQVIDSVNSISQPPVLEVVIDPECKRFGVPAFKTPGAAAIDLRAMLNTHLSRESISQAIADNSGVHPFYEEDRIARISLAPGAQVAIDSGLRIYIDNPSYAGLILPRSSSGRKGLVLANGIGLIDSDYQGPLTQVLWNRSREQVEINDGDRVCQYVLTNVHKFQMREVIDFAVKTERGDGGFGSTGAN